MSKNVRKPKTTTFRLSEYQREQLNQLAARYQDTNTAVIGKAIDRLYWQEFNVNPYALKASQQEERDYAPILITRNDA